MKFPLPLGTWLISPDTFGVIVEIHNNNADIHCSIMFLDGDSFEIDQYQWWEIEHWIADFNVEVETPDV